jgi:hypothetical protein
MGDQRELAPGRTIGRRARGPDRRVDQVDGGFDTGCVKSSRRQAGELGVDRDEARRAVKIASITPEAREAAREAGLDDNQSALLRIAAAPADDQVKAVEKIAEAKAEKPKRAAPKEVALDLGEAGLGKDRNAPPTFFEPVESDTPEQAERRKFLWLEASEIDASSWILADLDKSVVKSPAHIDDMIAASLAVIRAQEKISARLYEMAGHTLSPAETLFVDIKARLAKMSIKDIGEFGSLLRTYYVTRAVDQPVVDQPEPVAVEPVAEPVVDQPEPASEIERKMALADNEPVGPDLAAGARLSQLPTFVKKGTKGNGAVIRPDIAAEAAKLGLPVSPRAAA